MFITRIQIRSTQSFQSNTLKLHRLFPRKSCQFIHSLRNTVLKTISKPKCGHSQSRIIMSYLKLILRISQELIHSGNDLREFKDKICSLLRIKQLRLLVELHMELQSMLVVLLPLLDYFLSLLLISTPSLIQMLKRSLNISKHLLSNINKNDKLQSKCHNSNINSWINSSQLLNSNSHNLNQLNKHTLNLQLVF